MWDWREIEDSFEGNLPNFEKLSKSIDSLLYQIQKKHQELRENFLSRKNCFSIKILNLYRMMIPKQTSIDAINEYLKTENYQKYFL